MCRVPAASLAGPGARCRGIPPNSTCYRSGKQDTDGRIRQFFTTHTQLRVVFQAWGMPVRAVQVLRQQSAVHNAAVEQVQSLECTWESRHAGLRGDSHRRATAATGIV